MLLRLAHGKCHVMSLRFDARHVVSILAILFLCVFSATNCAWAQRLMRDTEEDCIIDGLSITLTAGKLSFDPNDEVWLDVRVHNTSKDDRYVGVCGTSKYDVCKKSTLVRINGQEEEIAGIPCYVEVSQDMGWDVRICSNGYSDRYKSALLLEPNDTLSFRIIVPSFGDGMDRPTRRFHIVSRFAVSRTAEGRRIIENGPETSLLIIDHQKLADAVQILRNGLSAEPKESHYIEMAIRAIADNPLPENAPLIAKAIRCNWSFTKYIEWNMWFAASQFESPEICEAAVAKAKDPNLGRRYASQVYKALYRNREFLRRADVLALVENPRLGDSTFTEVTALTNFNENGFLPSMLLACVAQQEDIERLAEMCARFLPARAGCDFRPTSLLARRLRAIGQSFMRYPDVSCPALRKVLELGMEPRQFKPWANEFGCGLVPSPIFMVSEWLAQMHDTETIAILEYYARPDRPRVFDRMWSKVPGYIAEIDGPEAITALRRLAPAGFYQRAKLGDPVAIDALLARGRHRRPDDDTFESPRCLAIVYSILEPDAAAPEYIFDPTEVESLWKERRQAFVQAFTDKYGFDPNSP